MLAGAPKILIAFFVLFDGILEENKGGANFVEHNTKNIIEKC